MRRLASGRYLFRIVSQLVAVGLGRAGCGDRTGRVEAGGAGACGRLLGALGAVTDLLQPGWRARGRRAIERALGPGIDARAVLRAGYRQLWGDLVDLYQEGARSGEDEIEGLEHLREPLAAGRGIVLLESSGFGLRYRPKRMLGERGIPLWQLHGPGHFGGEGSWLAARWVTPRFERAERRFVEGIIRLPASGSLAFSRTLLAVLGQGRVVCLAGDGRIGRRQLALPFLGATRPFATGWTSLARVTGAALVPAFAWAEAGGGVRLVLEPPLSGDRSAGRRASPALAHDSGAPALLREYARRLEAHTRRRPGCYIDWWRLVPGEGSIQRSVLRRKIR